MNKLRLYKSRGIFWRLAFANLNVLLPPISALLVPKNAGESEKSRLAHLMTYGVDPLAKPKPVNLTVENPRLAYLRRKLEGVKKTSDDEDRGDDDRFNECKLWIRLPPL